jgi:hypothetical protein
LMLIDSPLKRGRLVAPADNPSITREPHMKAKLELIDLGDAMKETKQLFWLPVFFDSAFGMGMLPG